MYLFEGSPIYAQPQPYTVLDSARDLLERFSFFEDSSYLEGMRGMLDSVEATENAEVVEGNVKLTVSISGDNAEFL
jgi:hypothetical protein